MARDILKTLKAEHDVVRGLFDELKETTDRATKKRSDLLAKIKKNLMPHAKWEEIVFYPAFKERADRDGLQTHAEAVEEHKAVEETVIPDVNAADVGTPQFAVARKYSASSSTITPARKKAPCSRWRARCSTPRNVRTSMSSTKNGSSLRLPPMPLPVPRRRPR